MSRKRLLIAIAIGIILFLLFKKRVEKYLLNRFIDRTREENLPRFLGVIDEKSVEKGKNISFNTTCIVAGLIRNGSAIIPRIMNNIYKITNNYRDYRILLVENDSVDDTRSRLLKWNEFDNRVIILGCGENTKKCQLNLPRTVAHDPDYPRIRKMAYLRNLYVDYIKRNLSNFEFLYILDLDIDAPIYSDCLSDAICVIDSHPDIDSLVFNSRNVRGSIFGSGIDSYFDPFALRFPGMKLGFENREEKETWDKHIEDNFRPCLINKLIPLKSGFGGLAMYRTLRIIENDAKYDSDPTIISCEHEYFCEKLRVYLYCQFPFLVLENEAL